MLLINIWFTDGKQYIKTPNGKLIELVRQVPVNNVTAKNVQNSVIESTKDLGVIVIDESQVPTNTENSVPEAQPLPPFSSNNAFQTPKSTPSRGVLVDSTNILVTEDDSSVAVASKTSSDPECMYFKTLVFMISTLLSNISFN